MKTRLRFIPVLVIMVALVVFALGVAVTEGSPTWVPDFQPNTQPQEIAGDIYTGGITVSAVDSSNDPIAGDITLVFGVQSGATDGFDLGIDGVAPLAPPSPPYVQPHFFYSANSVGPPDQQKLQVSIVPDTADVPEWPLVLFYFTGQGSSFTATVTLN